MNKPAKSLDWNQMRALLATVEAGSLSAAARQLGLTQPTLGRQVAALEAALGVTLFERAGRRLVLTEAGSELVAHMREMGAAAGRVALAAAGQSQSIEGLVRITASDIYAGFVLPPVLARLRDEAPGLAADVLASNSVNDLIRREADIAIRHVRPTEAGLVARRCPDTAARLYAAPAFVERHGLPADGAALAGVRMIGFSDRNADMIAELQARGAAVDAGNFPWRTNSGVVAWEWVRRGLGIGVMMETVGRVTPEVVPVWPQMPPIPVPVWLVTHRELHTSARIRLVFDRLCEALARG